jgi:RNA polymerase sigma factor (sigma-70 family)
VSATQPSEQFERVILPHLDCAYNLSRWLTRNEHDAQDVTQEACLRALRFIGTLQGENSRAWLLAIVRNTCRTWLTRNRPHELDGAESFDETFHSAESDEFNPEIFALRRADRELVRQAIEDLPIEFREVIVLREIEGLSYKEIANISDIPLGTVMSRLARGRKQLEHRLAGSMSKGSESEM